MVDISITDVKMITSVGPASLLLGETCVPFDIVQLVGSKYQLCVATDALLGNPSHILLQGGVDTEFVAALPLIGSYTLSGTALVKAAQYVVSATKGKVAPRADLITGQFLTDIFKAASTVIADFQIEESKIAVP